MENQLTDEELKDLGITRDLWDTWYNTMDYLYRTGRFIFNSNVKNGENEILIKDWTIKANFINCQYIEVVVEKNEIEYLTVRLNGNIQSVTNCVFEIVN